MVQIATKESLEAYVTKYARRKGEGFVLATDYAVGNGVTDDTAGLLAAVQAANGGVVYLPAGKRFKVQNLTFTTEHVNIVGPGPLVHQKGSSALRVQRAFGAPIGVTVSTVQFGATGVQGAQVLSRIDVTGGGYNRFKAGDAYHVSSNDTYTWGADDPGTMFATKAAFLSLLGIGMDIAGVTGSSVAEGVILQGATSGATGLVQSDISQGGTDYRVVLNSVSGDFTPGEALTVAAGGTASVAVGTAVGTAGAMYLLKSGRTFVDTYPTSAAIRFVDRAPICNLDITIDIDGDMDSYVAASQRKDAVIIEGQYMVDVKMRTRAAWSRGLTLKSVYRGTFDVRVDGLPNHTIADQSAFGYGVALAGATEGVEGKIHVRNVRHGFTTNTNAFAVWSADGTDGNGLVRYRDWGTVKYNTVTASYGQDTIAAVYDVHPGAYFTTFIGCRGLGTSGGGRLASDAHYVFFDRGIGTTFTDCHADGGGFGISGLQLNSGFKYTTWVRDCSVANFSQYGIHQYNTAVSDGAGGYWATLRIKGCDISGDGSAPGVPYAQKGIYLRTGRAIVEQTRISRFNDAPVLVSGAGVFEFNNVTADYSDGTGTKGFQVDGTVELEARYGIRATATAPAAVFENLSGSTAIRLFDLDRLMTTSTPALMLLTGGSGRIVSMQALNTTRAVSTITGSSGTLTLANRVNNPVSYFDTALTADRVVALPATATNNIAGDTWRVVRSANATGAFNIFVKNGATTVKALTTAGSWCEVAWDGTTWLLTASGTL